MKALLLSAGLGTRLRPITDSVPKCLVPIHDVPLLAIWLTRLFAAGIEEVVVNTHYLSEKVEAFIASSPYREKITIFREKDLLGTGGTLLATRSFFETGPLIVIHADNLSAINIAEMVATHQKRPDQTLMTMALFETDNPQSCGIVTTDETGIVTRFEEKVRNPSGTRANAAIYIIEQKIIDLCEELDKSFVDLSTEIIPNLVGQIHSYFISGYHRDIGSVEALQKAHEEFQASDLSALLAG